MLVRNYDVLSGKKPFLRFIEEKIQEVSDKKRLEIEYDICQDSPQSLSKNHKYFLYSSVKELYIFHIKGKCIDFNENNIRRKINNL